MSQTLGRWLNKKGSEYRFIGVSLSEQGLERYVAEQGLDIPIYSEIPAAARREYGMGGTPQTIIISPASRVLQNWNGAYVNDQRKQIEAFFRVTLPGIDDDQ